MPADASSAVVAGADLLLWLPIKSVARADSVTSIDAAAWLLSASLAGMAAGCAAEAAFSAGVAGWPLFWGAATAACKSALRDLAVCACMGGCMADSLEGAAAEIDSDVWEV